MKLLRKFLLNTLNDYWFNYIMFISKVHYFPNFLSPRSLNEKLNYIKIHKTNYNLRCCLSDRLKVRNYVKEKTPECELIDILWTGNYFTIEVWDSLPEKFVIKANHGSGMVKVVNKKYDTHVETQFVCNNWLKIDYSKIGKEWFYYNLDRILIVEEYLEFSGDVPPDFKFFCMNGKIELVQVDLDRFSGHTRNLYDKNFNRIDGELLYPQGYDIEKPNMYNHALNIAVKLSQEFDFIRVDLYLLDNKIYFGELTNIPGNGTEKFKPKKLDFELGKKLELSYETN